MSQIDVDHEFALDGATLEPVVLHGSCIRSLTGEIKCAVLSVLDRDGVDRIADIPQDAMTALEVRLRNAILSARVRDANEVGA